MLILRRTLIALFATLLVLYLLASPVVKWLAKDQIVKLGAEKVEIDGLYLNPFSGYLSISDLKIYDQSKQSFALAEFKADVRILELLQRHIHFSDIVIDGLILPVEVSPSGTLAGIFLSNETNSTVDEVKPSDASQQSKMVESNADRVEPAQQWHFGVDQLRLVNANIGYDDGAAGVSAEVSIEHFNINDLQSWNKESPGKISLSSALEFSSAPEDLNVVIKQINLDTLLGVYLDTVYGMLWHIDGGLKLSPVEINAQQQRLSLALLSVDTVYELTGWPGEITAVEGKVNINLAEMRAAQLGEEILFVAETQFNQLELLGKDEVKLAEVFVKDFNIYSGPESPLLQLQTLKVLQTELSQWNVLAINNITAENLQVDLRRNENGDMVLPAMTEDNADDSQTAQITPQSSSQSGRLDDGAENEATQSLAEQSAQPQVDTVEAIDGDEAEASTETQPLQWSLAQFELTGNNSVNFADVSVEPASKVALSELKVLAKNIHGKDLLYQLDFRVDSKLNEFGQIVVDGKPVEEKNATNEKAANFAVTGQMKSVDLPAYSPYLTDIFGYQFKSGKLNTDFALNIVAEEIDGGLDVKLNNVKLQAKDQETVKRLSKQFVMPLDIALDTLRDKNDDVSINIPVRGNLNEPSFSVNDVIRQVTAKALKLATFSAVKHVIQPYGTALTVATIATKTGKKLTAVKVEDIVFSALELELDATDKAVLDKLALLLAEKQKLRLNICSLTTAEEIAALTGEDGKKEHQGLALADQRSKVVKSYLLENKGIAADRLFLCQSQIDSEPGAAARVELSL